MSLSRRGFLSSAFVGCSLSAMPLVTPVAFAAAPGENRLVVIILRGAMDGIDVLRPLGDSDFMRYRSGLLGEGGATDLDGFFALHPLLAELLPLWNAGELAFAHAVSTPYRDKRSHFDGQDLLEAGTGMDVPADQERNGWLNRMLREVPGITAETAFAVGRGSSFILSGDAPFSSWAPEAELELSPQARLLLTEIYRQDEAFSAAGAEAMDLADTIDADGFGGKGAIGAIKSLAAFTAERMQAETRIASFSISGWDTHRRQVGAIKRALQGLSAALLTLREELGPVWANTTVLAMTEFGRTARENGTDGTDHGTGGAMLMAGGAIRGGQVHGTWPGLSESALYDRRDLMPTSDVRSYAAWAMRHLYGFERSVLERTIFPGLDMGDDPRLIL